MSMVQQIGESFEKKIDIKFYTSLTKMTQIHKKFILEQKFKAVLMLFAVVIYYLVLAEFDLYIIISIAYTCNAFFGVLIYEIMMAKFKSMQNTLKVAELLGHTNYELRNPKIRHNHKKLTDLLSETYDFTNLSNLELSRADRQNQQQVLTNDLPHQYLKDCFLLDCFKIIYLLLLLLIIIAYNVYFVQQIYNLSIGYLMRFSAIGCLILDITKIKMFQFYYEEQPQKKNQVAMVTDQRYSISQCQIQECCICFQKFEFGDSMKILQCNPKHIFHKDCIDRWFQIISTCPLCRKTPTS